MIQKNTYVVLKETLQRLELGTFNLGSSSNEVYGMGESILSLDSSKCNAFSHCRQKIVIHWIIMSIVHYVSLLNAYCSCHLIIP